MSSPRWMLFVDGENLTIRAQQYARSRPDAVPLVEGPLHMRDVFVWMPGVNALSRIYPWPLDGDAIRAHYYTSLVGDDAKLRGVREALWSLRFHPLVFKKEGREKAKGVDITLTKDMLAHAFLNNYDAAVLVAGDGDYVPLVSEVQRRGKIVYVAFFHGENLGLSPELRLAADAFMALDHEFSTRWSAKG